MKGIKNRSLITALLFLAFTSCQKDDTSNPNIELEDGKSTVIRDLPGDTNGSVGVVGEEKTKQGFNTFLFQLGNKKQIWLHNANDSAKWLKTDQWDLAFTAQYNSEIYLNNATIEKNPGFNGPVQNTAIVMIDRPYSEIDEAPSDDTFKNTNIIKIGMAETSYAAGWFFYNFNNHLAVPVKNRTWVLRLSNGNYAKLELISMYQGNPPEVTNMRWPAPYFTFRYYVQPDGSKNLNTRN